MKKKIIIRSIIIILFVGIGYEVFSIISKFSKEDNKMFESVKLTNTFDNKKDMISIQIQNDNDYDYHEAEDKTKWPDSSIYTYAGSTCINKDGTEIDAAGIITFDEVEYTAEIQTKNTVYCTLYFTKGKPALEVLKNNGGSKFNSTSAVFGLYRFNGTQSDVTSSNLNNFICFGTTDIPTCTGSEKQTYMYRIIGITDGSTTNTTLGLEANQLKIIRAYPSKTSQAWHSNYQIDQKWDVTDQKNGNHADITKYLNEDFLPKEKEKWKNTYWEGIIDEPYWYIGDNTNSGATNESGKSNRTHPVGLMYKSDFVNASTGTTSWLFIANGMTGSPSSNEWTMTRYGRDGSAYAAWYVATSGSLYTNDYVSFTFAVRPVYYLTFNVTLIGDGTETSPFIITSKN